ncbi:MAG: [Clostridia bacterium]|nr:[FeFe] hydrogenase H-cluster maturation GTPase HydF [Clostridia bacterium]
MSLNAAASAERVHIGFFGMRNAGKSSVVNAFTNQKLSLVSAVKGTTTDPVTKAMELLPLGPVVIIDTPGIDDEGELGEMRVKRAKQTLNKTDVAVLVVDAAVGLRENDRTLLDAFRAKSIPYIMVYNKADLLPVVPPAGEHEIYVSALNGDGMFELKERVARLMQSIKTDKTLLGDLVAAGDVVVLVTPIDESAPKGRMILPQQNTIRDVLDHGAINVVVKETELEQALAALKRPPRLVVTDSQAFGKIKDLIPTDVPLTSFSILFARYKGELQLTADGAFAINELRDGDTVLIAEACTHHRQCNDIGTVKLPGLLTARTGKKLNFAFTSGTEFPDDLSPYALVVHCGGCMINEREMKARLQSARDAGVPVTNYGILLAHLNGILQRALEPVLPKTEG